ncbi:MAG TPA: peptidase, partial [Calditrichaeota bacterium]|nr:peptidase [Calditrichota bacterium]
MKNNMLLFAVLLFSFIFVSCGQSTSESEGQSMIEKKSRQFARTVIKYDDSHLSERQKLVVEKLYKAAKIIDEIFLDQVYSKNGEIKKALENGQTPKDQWTLYYFTIMFGPFDRLDHNKPFYGHEKKPLGANFYPQDMTTEEFENWLKTHPEDEQAFRSEFTVIRRQGDKLVAIPYSEYYKKELSQAAMYLRKAADYADNIFLKKYLLTRADAFLSNDYYESDMAWMDLKGHDIEVVIGPYEVYEDELFNYKASFESFLTLRDPEESEKLALFGSYLNDMEKGLPIPDKYKNFERGSESPIVVTNEIFSAGDARAGVQTLAFNLPNDERV